MNRRGKYILKLCVITVLYIGVAVVVNLSNRILDVQERLTNGAFWWILLPSTLLLIAYSYLITFLYYRFTSAGMNRLLPQRVHPYGYRLLFVVLSVLFISLLQISFLVAVGEIAERPLHLERYLKRDYVYFLVPLFLFSMLLYDRPDMRLYRLRTHSEGQDQGKRLQPYEVDWRREKNISFLQFYLIERLGYREDIALDDIRYFDVFCFTSTRKQHILYLVNGERISVPFTTSAIEKWTLSEWFLKTNSGVVVNMIHVVYPIRDSRQLEINDLLNVNLTRYMRDEDIHSLLHVSKRLAAKNLRSFLNNIASLEDMGWDAKVNL